MSFYTLSEDLVLLRAAVAEQEETEETQMVLAYSSLGLIAVGASASVWMCLRQTFDRCKEEEVSMGRSECFEKYSYFLYAFFSCRVVVGGGS